MPSNALELALFLESDRMGYLLDTMTPALVDGQRDVVKNERRQSYENRPYGMASLELDEMLWPGAIPYHWPVIGYMEDLTAASYDDVVDFFKKYYAPNNASLVIAGDIDFDTHAGARREVVRRDPARRRRGAGRAAGRAARGVDTQTLTDHVRLPRLYLAWLTPRRFAPGDATLDVARAVLADGKNSRLYKRLVYDLQIAQDVTAYQGSAATRQLVPDHGDGASGSHGRRARNAVIDEELAKLQREPPSRAKSSVR